jgi:hypothetical protein
MATVKGKIEAISRKYDKFSVMVNDNWYGTKKEWTPSPEPTKGDTIEFDDGGKKYLSKCRIVEKGAYSAGAGAKSGGKTWNNLGVELGHASNIAKDIAMRSDVAPGSDDWYRVWVENTEKVFKVMKKLRTKYEEEATKTPIPKTEGVEDVVVYKFESTPESTPEEIEDDIFG